MDTNTLAMMIALMGQKQAVAPEVNNTIQVVTLILAALGPVLASVAAYFASRAMGNAQEAKANTLATKSNSEAAVALATETTEEVKKIHVAVNSGRTAMEEEAKLLRGEIQKLSAENATLTEKTRGMEVAAVVKESSDKAITQAASTQA